MPTVVSVIAIFVVKIAFILQTRIFHFNTQGFLLQQRVHAAM